MHGQRPGRAAEKNAVAQAANHKRTRLQRQRRAFGRPQMDAKDADRSEGIDAPSRNEP
jgi:hypothetical protein